MLNFKCKMCGGDIHAIDGATHGTCDSCGTTSTLPKANDEKIVNLFNRANHFRRLNEFDKALAAYDNILNEDSTNAEAHWGIVLCRYGIEYVEDPRTRERVPTCHRAQYASVLSDTDYLTALENAPDSYTKELYEAEAAKISNIQKGILAISNREEPFDVFICYKETTDGGSRTKDSTLAQDIYYQLSNDGYRVFFSKITLEDKLGHEYEPYIFAALNSAKVMLVIGTKPEYFNAVWVKNEWSRFLSLMKNDRSRLLIPCYRDMEPYDMPGELSNLQSLDMGKIGFVQDLVRGVKKVLDSDKIDEATKSSTSSKSPIVPKMFSDKALKESKAELMRQIAKNNNDIAELQDKIRDEEKWMQHYYDKQNQDEREHNSDWVNDGYSYYNTYTYKSNLEAYDRCKKSRDESKSLIERFKAEQTDLNIELANLDDSLRLTPTERTEIHYQTLLEEKNESTEESEFLVLASEFRRMEGYKDTASLADECENAALEMPYKKLVAQIKSILDNDKMTKGANTEDAFRKFASQFRDMNGYKDTNELADECENLADKMRYDGLIAQMKSTNTEDGYRNLASDFRKMGDYKEATALVSECENRAKQCAAEARDAKYQRLLKQKSNAKTEENFHKLVRSFRKMKEYKDSEALADECEAQYRTLKEQRELKASRELERQRRIAKEQQRIESERRREQERREAREAKKNVIIANTMVALGIACIIGMLIYIIYISYAVEETALVFLVVIFVGIMPFAILIYSRVRPDEASVGKYIASGVLPTGASYLSLYGAQYYQQAGGRYQRVTIREDNVTRFVRELIPLPSELPTIIEAIGSIAYVLPVILIISCIVCNIHSRKIR